MWENVLQYPILLLSSVKFHLHSVVLYEFCFISLSKIFCEDQRIFSINFVHSFMHPSTNCMSSALTSTKNTMGKKWMKSFSHNTCIRVFTSFVSERKVKVMSLSSVRLFETPWTVAYQAPLSLGFSRQGYWSGLPFPSPEDLPDPGIEPGSSIL